MRNAVEHLVQHVILYGTLWCFTSTVVTPKVLYNNKQDTQRCCPSACAPALPEL